MSPTGNGSEMTTEFEPILFEIIEGAIESARREMEIQVERTARSTIVREQHDHRSGIFDSHGNSVTALSFASVPTPVMTKFRRQHPSGRRLPLQRPLQVRRGHHPPRRHVPHEAGLLR